MGALSKERYQNEEIDEVVKEKEVTNEKVETQNVMKGNNSAGQPLYVPWWLP
jgi:hypothetical protein